MRTFDFFTAGDIIIIIIVIIIIAIMSSSKAAIDGRRASLSRLHLRRSWLRRRICPVLS